MGSVKNRHAWRVNAEGRGADASGIVQLLYRPKKPFAPHSDE